MTVRESRIDTVTLASLKIGDVILLNTKPATILELADEDVARMRVRYQRCPGIPAATTLPADTLVLKVTR